MVSVVFLKEKIPPEEQRNCMYSFQFSSKSKNKLFLSSSSSCISLKAATHMLAKMMKMGWKIRIVVIDSLDAARHHLDDCLHRKWVASALGTMLMCIFGERGLCTVLYVLYLTPPLKVKRG